MPMLQRLRIKTVKKTEEVPDLNKMLVLVGGDKVVSKCIIRVIQVVIKYPRQYIKVLCHNLTREKIVGVSVMVQMGLLALDIILKVAHCSKHARLKSMISFFYCLVLNLMFPVLLRCN